MSQFDKERIKEIAEQLGFKVTQGKEGEGGIFFGQPDGSSRRLETDELLEMMFPGSLELLTEPNEEDNGKD